MPLGLSTFERFPTTNRDEFARSALAYCRAMRSNPKVRSTRFYWVDGGNTIGFAIDGEPGWNDYNPEPNMEVAKAGFKLMDLARRTSIATWADANVGERTWDRAGRPSGTS